MAWWRWPAVRTVENPVAVLLPEPLAGEVRALLVRDEYVAAVRLVREQTGLTLLPAVRAVNRIRDADAP